MKVQIKISSSQIENILFFTKSILKLDNKAVVNGLPPVLFFKHFVLDQE